MGSRFWLSLTGPRLVRLTNRSHNVLVAAGFVSRPGRPMASNDLFLLAAVLVWPTAPPRPPALHNFWFAQHGLQGSYVPLAVPPERLEAALRALPALNFAGCNLTIPLKQDAMRIVDE